MYSKFMIAAIVTIVILFSSCEKHIFNLEYVNGPVGNFEYFWSEFNQMYGLFKVRNVDWDEVYRQYRPLVDETTSDTELYRILVEMLEILDDGHVILVPVGTDLPMYTGGPVGRIDTARDFDLDILKENYLPDPRETENGLLFDFITDDIGYVYIDNFGGDEKAFDRDTREVLDALRSARGLVVDIRGGDGGEDIAGKTIASFFADRRRLYMTNSIKNGPGPDDFTAPMEWYIEPRGDVQFTKPVALLTNRQTISARETFQLAMKTLPNVTTVGDTTAGAFSNLVTRELPNGWGYSMSIGDWRAADGISYEGQGIPPEVLVRNRREDLLAGKDEALEAAIGLLQ